MASCPSYLAPPPRVNTLLYTPGATPLEEGSSLVEARENDPFQGLASDM